MDTATQLYPLSAQQRRILARGAARVSTCRFSVPRRATAGEVRAAVEDLAAAHDMMRVRFHEPAGQRLPLMHVEPAGRIRVVFAGGAEAPPPRGEVPVTESGPELRVFEDGHTLELSCPTLLGDGQAVLDLCAALAERLAGRPPSGPVPGYLRFSAWQAEILEQAQAEERAFWEARRDRLVRCEPPVHAHEPPPGARRGWGSLPLALSDGDATALVQAARALRVPLGELVLACWASVLAQNRGRQEVCLGVTFAGREFEAFSRIAGPIARTLPVLVHPAPSLAEMLPRLRAELDEQREWEHCFDWGLRDGDAPRFASGFRCLEVPLAGSDLLRVHGLVDADDAASVFCSVLHHGDRAHVQIDFDPSRCDERALLPVRRQLEILLSGVARHPDAPLPERLVHEHDHRLVTRDFQPPAVPRPAGIGAAALFRQHALRRPRSPAILDEAGEISYGELDAWARALADRLRAHPAERVGILLRPGAPLAAAMIAALYAGKPHVILDPEDPARRRAHILADARVELMLTSADLAGLSDGAPGQRLFVERGASSAAPGGDLRVPGEDAPAYIIYTSGTTGRPKGVEVSSGALANYVLWLRDSIGIDETDRGALLTSPAYDLGYTALWGALLNGGALFLPSEQLLGDPHRLVAELRDRRVTFLKVTPSLLRMLLEVDAEGFGEEPLRAIVIGGELVRTADLLRLHRRAPHLTVVHHYGPTEATIGCIAERIPPGEIAAFCERPALGRPISNASIYVLDGALRPVAPGAVGEICVGGRCLSVGYLGQPDLTAQRFVVVPGIGRVYRTGDLGTWGADGRVRFLGRADAQLKVRGIRVEPEGIARVLAELPALEDVAVAAAMGPNGQPELVACCVPSLSRAGIVRRLCRLVADEPSLASSWVELPNGWPIVGLHHAETWFMYREIFEERCYLRPEVSLRPGDVVVDVGANVGMFALQASIMAPGARIVAIEPAPAAFVRLEANASLHGGGWTCLSAAVGAVPGEAELTLYRDHSLLSTLRPARDEDRRLLGALAERRHATMDERARQEMAAAIDEQLDATRVSCPVVTLSQIIAAQDLARIDLLKVDVQRAELDVLLGITAEHWPRIAQVVLEVQDDGARLSGVSRLLAAQGFDVRIEHTALHAGTDHAMVHAVRPERARAPAALPSAALPSAPPPSAPAWAAPSALVAAIRRHAADELPAPLVPARVILADRLPLTANAKLRREALDAIAAGGIELERRLTPPTTDLGRRLAALWSACLGVEPIGLESHFLELGGQSLLAARLTNRIRHDLGLPLTMAEVLRNPRFGQLLSLLASRDQQTSPSVAKAPLGEVYPLSHLQARLWVLCQLDGGSEAYNLSRAFRLRGALDLALLREAVTALVARHDALRTSVVPEEMAQRTWPPGERAVEIAVEAHDGGWDARGAAARADAEAVRPFDLTRDTPFRALIVGFSDDSTLLVITTHHIVGDGWSVEILVSELFEAYANLRAGAPAFAAPLAQQHRDVMHALNVLAEDTRARAAAHLARWSGKPVAPLPFDLAEPPRPTFRGAAHEITVPAGLAHALHALAARHRVSTFSVCAAALNALLARWTGAEDVVLGATVSGRDLPGSLGQVGYLANTVLLCARVRDEDTFEDLVRRTSEAVVEALTFQHLPLDAWVGALRTPRRGGVSVLPAVGVTWYEIDRTTQVDRLGARCGLTCEEIAVDEQAARADLWFFVRVSEAIEWRIIFNRALFLPETIAAVGEALLRTLDLFAGLAAGGRPLSVAELPAVGRSGFHDAELDFTVQM